MNLDEALQRIPGGAKGLAKLCAVFQLECQQLLAILAEAIERGDVDEIRRASHTIKGSAKLFSASRVSDVALEMERSAKAGQLHETPRLYGILRSEVAELQAALELHLGPGERP